MKIVLLLTIFVSRFPIQKPVKSDFSNRKSSGMEFADEKLLEMYSNYTEIFQKQPRKIFLSIGKHLEQSTWIGKPSKLTSLIKKPEELISVVEAQGNHFHG